MDASIDAIGSLFQRYRTLLTGHTGGGLTPVIIDKLAGDLPSAVDHMN